jgi:soluble lytic murein transglycosylase
MSAAEQRDAAWVYWKARAPAGPRAARHRRRRPRASAQLMLGSIAGRLGFYGKLAAEDLGGPWLLPPTPRR